MKYEFIDYCVIPVIMISFSLFHKGRNIPTMAMCYKRLWKLLIDRDMTRADLRKVTGISPATIAKMSKGEPVGAGIFERICEALHCNIGDIADYVPGANVKGKLENER